MDFCEEFSEIEPLPGCDSWCREMSDIHAMGCAVAPPCCDKRVSTTDEIAHYLAHEVKFGDLEVEPEDMAKKLTLDMLSVKVRDSDAAAEFDKLRLKYLHQYKGGNKHVMQTNLAKGVPLQDAPMITAVCRALNKHVGIVSKHGHWSTRKDANFWACDVLLVICANPDGAALPRFLRVVALEETNKLVARMPVQSFDESVVACNVFAPGGQTYTVPIPPVSVLRCLDLPLCSTLLRMELESFCTSRRKKALRSRRKVFKKLCVVFFVE